MERQARGDIKALENNTEQLGLYFVDNGIIDGF
jgi:hypothetical protein